DSHHPALGASVQKKQPHIIHQVSACWVLSEAACVIRKARAVDGLINRPLFRGANEQSNRSADTDDRANSTRDFLNINAWVRERRRCHQYSSLPLKRNSSISNKRFSFNEYIVPDSGE